MTPSDALYWTRIAAVAVSRWPMFARAELASYLEAGADGDVEVLALAGCVREHPGRPGFRLACALA